MPRLLEMVPGALSWATIALMVLLSWRIPAAIAIFIILFDIYWLLKTVYLYLHLRSSFRTMRTHAKIDWLAALSALDPYSLRGIRDWRDVYHLVILPMYNEPYAVIKESLECIQRAQYPKDHLIVVLAIEARAGAAAQETAARIEQEFGTEFFTLLVTTHPADIPGELPGKGSNEAWAGKQVKMRVIDPSGISYDRIIASVFDADTQIPPHYFGRLTHAFLTAENPQHSSYQPIPFFTNHIFQAPAMAWIISFSTTFWNMMQQSQPERLITFSSHAMPFQALVDIGFWHTDKVSEDSLIFWQCYLYYNGNWRVVPLLYPVSMDANAAPAFWQTMANLYKQQRRWAWGAENIPYLLNGFRKNPRIPFKKKLYWAFVTIEGFHSWATNALIILALGWLPILLGGPGFTTTLLAHNLPRTTQYIMTLSMFGVMTSVALSLFLLPPRPAWFKFRHYTLYVLQWFLTPITLIAFGAIPAFEAQTRLMLGGKFRLGFWVTPKHRDIVKTPRHSLEKRL